MAILDEWKAEARRPDLDYSAVENIIIRGVMNMMPGTREGFNVNDTFEQLGIFKIGQVQRAREMYGVIFGIKIPEDKLRGHTTVKELTDYIFTLTI